MQFRKYIADISCNGKTEFTEAHQGILQQFTYPKLADMQNDGLITWSPKGLSVTDTGHSFIRNICSAFDLFLNQSNSGTKIFSNGI